jgi:hypothetical protein
LKRILAFEPVSRSVERMEGFSGDPMKGKTSLEGGIA